uniref:DUF1907 domain-containing protein n=1 Tax=Oxyrrhis marina TaxID=2969 RepID=A0A7S4GQE8_OXYMA|mmetsp:Transcript_38051/g.91288  ORF Transcript_38051/g.91288 Transcript_38051/m.91288 type:complete len:350 (-) Transcript_38051:430-1479(-)
MSQSWPLESYALSPPTLDELRDVLAEGLGSNYEDVDVSVVPCPNLREAPFGLVSQGLSGGTCVIDVGGVDNLFPKVNLTKEYCLREVAQQIGISEPHFLGAGSCGYSCTGRNSELVVNAGLNENRSKCIVMDDDHVECCVRDYHEHRVSALANVFCSAGEAGQVLRLHVKHRKGEIADFVGCIQRALRMKFGDRPVSVGGSFVMHKGTAKIHVMSDFTQDPIMSQEFIDKTWLKFFEGKAPMTFMFVCTSVDPPNLSMRLTHTHGHNSEDNNLGGHYHYDLTREVEYECYLNVAEVVHRVDKQHQSPTWDKDLDFPTNTVSAPGTPCPAAASKRPVVAPEQRPAIGSAL